MSGERDRQFVELLSLGLRRSKELQKEGRLRSAASRMEMALLERRLAVAKARLASDRVRAATALGDEAWSLVTSAEDACEASRAVLSVSVAVHQEAQRVRKLVYRTRLEIALA